MAVPIPGVLPGPREHETLWLIADGLTNDQIAKRMRINRSTVAYYISNLFVRFEATNRASLVHRAHLRGLLAPSGSANAHDSFQGGFESGWLAAIHAAGKALGELERQVTSQ